MLTITETLYKKMPDDIKVCFNQIPNPSCEEVRECFPESNPSKQNKTSDNRQNRGNSMFIDGIRNPENSYTDSGNASRFFKSIIYQSKASKGERNKGCEEIYILKDNTPKEDIDEIKHLLSEKKLITQEQYNKLPERLQEHFGKGNVHPTVKSVALMEYLINMVTKEGQTVVDPFAGSFTTGVACINLKRKFIGIEQEEEYIKIGRARISCAEKEMGSKLF